MTLGLGEAIARLVRIETLQTRGLRPTEEMRAEAQMIVDALNQYTLDLNFACSIEVAPDNGIGIFEQSVATSCCRLVSTSDTSRG